MLVQCQTTDGSLLNTYILTGCDTIRFIFHKNKSRVLKVEEGYFGKLDEFGAYGEVSNVNMEMPINGARYIFKCVYERPDCPEKPGHALHTFICHN